VRLLKKNVAPTGFGTFTHGNTMAETLEAGDRCSCPGGLGTIVYKRMAAPDYTHVAVYSVKLDNGVYTNGTTGSIYPASEVSAEETLSQILKELSHGQS
jgi:hypothetical protein